MKLLTVAELSRLPWNSPVAGVVGVVQMVHPKMGKAGWSLQNGRLADPGGTPVVEFMLSKHEHYWEPEQVRGRRVEIRSTLPDDLVWKEQKAKPNVNGGRPFAKLEVAVTAQMVFGDDATPTLPGLGTPVAPEPAPFTLPLNPRVNPPANRASPPAAASVAELRTQLRQMVGLYAVVERVVVESVKEPERPLLQERLFAQACAAGLFRELDPEAVAIELDPAAFARTHPNQARLAELAKGREDMLNVMLRGTGAIRMDATWQDLSETEAGQVLQRQDLIGVFAKAS